MASKKRVLENLDLDIELQALHQNLMADSKTWNITQKQVTTLASLMGEGLKDRKRENRLNVLRLLCQNAVFTKTGYVIESTKQIPGEMASVVIDLLIIDNIDWELSDNGRQLLSLAEERVKTGTNKDKD